MFLMPFLDLAHHVAYAADSVLDRA
jgi:hypothetical protein